MFKDKDGVEWLTYKEIASQYGIGNSTVGNWVREMEVNTISLPKTEGQIGGRASIGVKAEDAATMMQLHGVKPKVTNGATKNEKADASLKAYQKENPKKRKPRKERARMSLHNIKAPFCPFCGAHKVANVTTQSLRLCLKCGNVYTVQKFREGVDNETD